MNTNVEEMLREGMERFTEGVRAPAPATLVRAASQRRRRRLAVRATAACVTAAATAAAAVAVIGATAEPAGNGASTRTVAYVAGRVRHALATENLVYQGQSTGSDGSRSTTWAYGQQSQWLEYTSAGKLYSAEGSAVVGGQHLTVYVFYPDRRWTGSLGWGGERPSACTTTGSEEIAAVPMPTFHWASFISHTLACGGASVTGHVVINGVDTLQITGKPVTVRLSPAYAKVVHEKFARTEWSMYVDPATYLPVRITGATQTFGGSGGYTNGSMVTNVQWLPPTAANIASTLVTIPAGFQRVSQASV